jgi:hypothetical protein
MRFTCDGDVCHKPEFGKLDENFGVVFAESQRRNDRATAECAKRPLQKSTVLTEVRIKKRDQRLDVIDRGNAQSKRLAGSRELCVRDIYIVNIDVVAVFRSDKGLTDIVYVFELIREARRIVQIGEPGRPELLCFKVEDRDRFT